MCKPPQSKKKENSKRPIIDTKENTMKAPDIKASRHQGIQASRHPGIASRTSHSTRVSVEELLNS
jgi:hypothetical protein